LFYLHYIGFDTWTFEVGGFSPSDKEFNGYSGAPFAGAWANGAPVAREIDTEFTDIKRYGGGGWVNFSGSAYPCEDSGYDLREVTTSHVWAEKQ
jgi:hypothetical protein